MDASTIAAWWGAIVGSFAVLWDVIKWSKSGPRLRISVSSNMETIFPGRGYDKTLRVLVNVRNVGDQPTTITHFLGFAYKSRLQHIRKKPEFTFIINAGTETQVPCKISPGETWSGLALQSEFDKFLTSAPCIYLGIQHSMAKKPICARLVINKSR